MARIQCVNGALSSWGSICFIFFILLHSFLPRGQKTTLTRVLTILLEEYLPAQLSKYIDTNVFQSSQYSKYAAQVPDYLQNRPRKVIVHCLSRRTKSFKYEPGELTTLLRFIECSLQFARQCYAHIAFLSPFHKINHTLLKDIQLVFYWYLFFAFRECSCN